MGECIKGITRKQVEYIRYFPYKPMLAMVVALKRGSKPTVFIITRRPSIVWETCSILKTLR